MLIPTGFICGVGKKCTLVRTALKGGDVKLSSYALLILLSYSCSSSTIHAELTGVNVGTNPQQRLIIENLNLSGKNFFTAYMSKDVQQRQLAEMYLAGVLDTGENKLWCGYRLALPSSLQEVIYLGFKNQSAESLNRRASEVINEILANKLACRAAK